MMSLYIAAAVPAVGDPSTDNVGLQWSASHLFFKAMLSP